MRFMFFFILSALTSATALADDPPCTPGEQVVVVAADTSHTRSFSEPKSQTEPLVWVENHDENAVDAYVVCGKPDLVADAGVTSALVKAGTSMLVGKFGGGNFGNQCAAIAPAGTATVHFTSCGPKIINVPQRALR
jgi:hypothetical protein